MSHASVSIVGRVFFVLLSSVCVCANDARGEVKRIGIENDQVRIEFVLDTETSDLALAELTNKCTGFTHLFNESLDLVSFEMIKIDDYFLHGTRVTEEHDLSDFLFADVTDTLTRDGNVQTLTLHFTGGNLAGIGTINDFTMRVELDDADDVSRWTYTIDYQLSNFGLYMIRTLFPFVPDPLYEMTALQPNLGNVILVRDPAYNLSDLRVCDDSVPEGDPVPECGVPGQFECSADRTPNCVLRGSIANSPTVGMQLHAVLVNGGSVREVAYVATGDEEGTSAKWRHTKGSDPKNSSGDRDYLLSLGYINPEEAYPIHGFTTTYPVIFGALEGEEYDAAQRYKEWAQNESRFMDGGRLKDRADLSEEVKKAGLFVIVDTDEVKWPLMDPDVRAAYIDIVTDNLSFYLGRTNSFPILFRYNWLDLSNLTYESVVPGYDLLVSEMRSNPALDLHGLYTLSNAAGESSEKGIEYDVGAAASRKITGDKTFPHPWDPDVVLMDPGEPEFQAYMSEYVLTQQVVGLMNANGVFMDNPYRDTVGGCYDQIHSREHAHTDELGRGPFIRAGYQSLVEEVKNTLVALDPNGWNFTERSDELFLNASMTSSWGHGVWVGGHNVIRDNTSAFISGQTFRFVYGAYTLSLGANPHFAIGVHQDSVALWSYSLAKGVAMGLIPAIFEEILDTSPDYGDCTMRNLTADHCFGSESEQGGIIVEFAHFLKRVAEDRELGFDGIVLGEMLRPPQTDSPLQELHFPPPRVPSGNPYTIEDQRVLANAFECADDPESPILYLLNYNRDPQSENVALSLDMDDLHLQRGVRYGLYEMLDSGRLAFITSFTDDTVVSVTLNRLDTKLLKVKRMKVDTMKNKQTK